VVQKDKPSKERLTPLFFFRLENGFNIANPVSGFTGVSFMDTGTEKKLSFQRQALCHQWQQKL